MSDRARVGVIGLGMAGSGHFDSMAKCGRAKVTCVADSDPAALARAEKAVPGIACFQDYRDLLRRDDLDLAVIATPHHLHARMVLDALGAGKHVLCEKPLAISTAECDQMIAAARETGRTLFAVQNQRTSPLFRRLKRVVAENDLGRPVGALLKYLGYEGVRMADPKSWKGSYDQAGGGVLLDGGCHMFDLANWYCGRPLAVLASCHRPQQWPAHKAETTAHVIVEYENGVTAQVLATFEARLPGSFTQGILQMTAELFYEQGYAQADYAYYGPAGSHRSLRYVCRSDQWNTVELTPDDGLDYDGHIVTCLLTGARPIVTADEARAAVALAEASYESAKTGQRVALS